MDRRRLLAYNSITFTLAFLTFCAGKSDIKQPVLWYRTISDLRYFLDQLYDPKQA
jgi:hypothetical protein